MGKLKIKKHKKENMQNEFTLKGIQELGGDEDDYEMLKNVDIATEKGGSGKKADFDEEPINENELLSFMDDLGIAKARKEFMLELSPKDKEDKKNNKTKSQEKDANEDFTIEANKNKKKNKKRSQQEDTNEDFNTEAKTDKKKKKKRSQEEDTNEDFNTEANTGKKKKKKRSQEEKIDDDFSTEDKKHKKKKKKRSQEEETDEDFGNEDKKDKKKKKKRSPKEQTNKQAEADTRNLLKIKKKNKYKVQESEVSSTTLDQEGEPLDYLSVYKTRSHLLVKPGSKWFSQEFSGDPTEFSEPSTSLVSRLKKYAERLYEDEAELFKKHNEKKKRSETSWMKKVLISGTVADRSAALTLLVQDGPVQNLHSLDMLIAMVHKKGHREAQAAMVTLKELFISDLLPDRKLRTFSQHPLGDIEALSSGNKDSRDKRLLLWYFEEQLKDRYSTFIEEVKIRGQDTVQATKKNAIDTTMELLAAKSEQEQVLLAILVNKLGDQMSKTASYVVHTLNKLVERHPNMKFVVVQEVERMLYRSHISVKAQYYAVCFLNQLDLCQREKDLAARLIVVFFSFFKSFVKKGEVDSKMLSALLTGVNRVYPYAKVEQEKIHEQLNTLYQITHLTNFNTGIQALMLLYQVVDTSDSATDRFYQALYRKLLDPGLQTSSKQAMFLNLVYKSLRKDTVDTRLKAFIKRLLQICCHQTPPFICGTLFLLSQVLSEKPNLLNFTQMDSQYSDEDEEHFTDVKLEDSDSEFPRSSVEAKTQRPAPSRMVDSHTSDEGNHKKGTSWVHRKNLGGRSFGSEYNPHHRNPLFCQADRECIWELENLSQHYHPSVSLFAEKLLKGETITYDGDPLQDFTLIRFLDRFVFKNPKKKPKEESESINRKFLQSKRRGYLPVGMKAIPVNSDQYKLLDEASIPEDEKFFYRFFRQQTKASKEDDLSDASVSDDEFDGFLDKYEMSKGLDADGGADFAGDFQRSNKKKKKGKPSSESDSDMDSDLDLSDEEPDFAVGDLSEDEADDIQETVGDTAGFDEEEVAFSDEDDTFVAMSNMKGKRSKSGGPPVKKSRIDKGTLFTAAEKFADVMEENMGDKMNTIGTEALSNRDKSDAKQLKWEMDRDRKLSGKHWKGKHKKQQKFKHKGASRSKRKK